MGTSEKPEELSDRERTVLHYIVHDFIETATPIGSRYISKRHEDVLGLSSASIRNVMSDLEYLGYLNHPHTSAGRIPTDRGYRFYLDSLIKIEDLSNSEKERIRHNLDTVEEQDGLLRECARLLGRVTRQLAIVSTPQLSGGVLEKMELVQISGTRLMVIISIKSGLVRTIMMEVTSEIPREKLDDLAQFLNERLSGLTLEQIRDTLPERMRDARDEETGLIRMFVDSVDKLFTMKGAEKLHIAGTGEILDQPEFLNPRDFRSIIELINNEEMIIHVLEKSEGHPYQVHVSIGTENVDEKLKPYSVITSTYTVGNVPGSIGLIGPTRMPYSRMIPLVDYVARTVSELFSTTHKA